MFYQKTKKEQLFSCTTIMHLQSNLHLRALRPRHVYGAGKCFHKADWFRNNPFSSTTSHSTLQLRKFHLKNATNQISIKPRTSDLGPCSSSEPIYSGTKFRKRPSKVHTDDYLPLFILIPLCHFLLPSPSARALFPGDHKLNSSRLSSKTSGWMDEQGGHSWYFLVLCLWCRICNTARSLIQAISSSMKESVKVCFCFNTIFLNV